MSAAEIMKEIQKLSTEDRILVIESAIKNLRREEIYRKMGRAADELFDEYRADEDLRAFTSLDIEDFYEPR